MSRRAARFTQADIARAIRAARQEGAGVVEVRPDGTILIAVEPGADRRGSISTTEVASEKEIVL